MSLGIFIDLFLGDPQSSLHPIALLGRILSFFEKLFYPWKQKKFSGGIYYVLMVFGLSTLIELPLHKLPSWASYLYLSFWVYFLLCGRTLVLAGYSVKQALEQSVQQGRVALSHYVGRSTQDLTEEEIIKGTLETMAENTSDGIIGPIFYLLLGFLLGFPLLFMAFFKLTNTLDSMVGYKNKRYSDFGFVSAKMDDLLGFLPARITALLFLLGGWVFSMPTKKAWSVYLRDRRNHLSPNAGQSEAMVAGLLGVALGGSHYYGDSYVVKPTLGVEERPVEPNMIDQVAKLLFFSEALLLPLSLLLEVL